MGSIDRQSTLESYSAQDETRKLLQDGIFKNPKVARNLPQGTSDFASRVNFTGAGLPSIPINWRVAESAAALKGLEACLIAELVKRKYGVDVESARINTDHASLFFMSCVLWTVTGETAISDPKPAPVGWENQKWIDELIPNYNFYQSPATAYKGAVTNLYETKDGRWFHLHGSLNPGPSLQSIGLPLTPDDPQVNTDWVKARDLIASRVKAIDSTEMQHLASDVHKQAGVIANSVEQFRKSDHGKANEHVGLFEIHNVDSGHSPSWWPEAPTTSASRPLAGLKVIDLCRIIAAPAVTRGLAELGASVMRVTSPNLPDFHSLHIDLNWGKWNCSLDLKKPGSIEKLKSLILEADVVMQGYRPGVFDKYGFGQDGIIDLVKGRERGIISVRENCYGWNGPWQGRSGWQQISDACVGVSHRFGQVLGLENDEPVTPVFPNSDYQTGISGVCAILSALIKRGETGGSYKVDVALNYYSQWLVESVGEYPQDIWENVWGVNGRKVFRAYDNMSITVPAYIKMLKASSQETVFNKEFFEDRESKAIGASFHMVKPIINFDNGEVELGYNVGTRGNGKDAARWPDDLMTEVVV